MTDEQARRRLAELPGPQATMPAADRIWALRALEREFQERSARADSFAWINASAKAAFAAGLLIALIATTRALG